MRLILIFVVFFHFNSFGQRDSVVFIKNGYTFSTSLNTLVNHFNIERGSVEFYRNEFKAKNYPELIPSDSIVKFASWEISFETMLMIFYTDQSLVKIQDMLSETSTELKVKIRKKVLDNKTLGGASETYITIVDKKKKIAILENELVFRSLAD